MDLEHFATTAMPFAGMRRPLSSRFAPAGWLRGSRIGVFFFAPHVMYPAPPGPEWVWCPRAPWDSSLAFLGHDPSNVIICPPGPQPAVATDSMPLDGSSRRPLRRRQRRRRAVRLEPPGIAADTAPSDVSCIQHEADPNGPRDGSSAPESPPSLEVPSWSVSSRAIFDLRNSNSFTRSPRRPTIDSDVLNDVLQNLLDRNILERARPTIGSGPPSIDGTVERQQLGAALADAARPAPERREALRPGIEPRGVVQARVMSRQIRAPSCDMQFGPSRRRPYTGAHSVIPPNEVPPLARPGRGNPAATRAQQQVRPGSIVVYNSNRRRYQPETMPRLPQAGPSQGRSPSSQQRSRQAQRQSPGRLICPALSGLDLFVAVIDSLWLAEETAVESALNWMEGELPGLRDRQRNFSRQFYADRQFLRRRAERADANLRSMASGSQPRRLLSSVQRSIRALFGEDDSSLSSDDDSPAEAPAEERTCTNAASRNADEAVTQERRGLLPAVRRLDSHHDDALAHGAIRDGELTARDGINEIFTCPMCHDPILPLYSQCPSGHALCDRCRRSYTDRRCLVCRVDHIPQINSALSSLSDKLSFPCRYNYLGCPWNPLGTEWHEHVRGCAYCPGLSARTREQISALIAHSSRSSAE
ncbi:hypothetical protein QAD02_007060 [Eretmocerus hayati]|uniref:Uncharacterized protein n=1 Tax=Eretmocerus hayati TaxID=131215 RepID=A0ACC2N341_9HYME|nr:hypothetical protein QAD02_007060 [Eretmocerus hayati]